MHASSGAMADGCVLVTNMAYQYPGDFGYDLIMGFRKLAEPGGFRVDVVELTDDL